MREPSPRPPQAVGSEIATDSVASLAVVWWPRKQKKCRFLPTLIPDINIGLSRGSFTPEEPKNTNGGHVLIILAVAITGSGSGVEMGDFSLSQGRD